MDAAPGNSIAVSLRIAKAMSLAREGHGKEAQALLSVDRAIPEDTLSLEVLAVLATNEGDYLRGLRLWEQLLQRNPEHAEARRMIEAIELWLGRPTWAKYVPVGAATAAALVVAGIFWAIASGPSPAPLRRAPANLTASPIAVSPSLHPAAPPRPEPAAPAPTVSFPPSRSTRR